MHEFNNTGIGALNINKVGTETAKTFDKIVNEIRASIKNLSQVLKDVANNTEKRPVNDKENRGEVMANLTLSYRHLEDASMRLGKVLQAFDGGISIYDKKTTQPTVKTPSEISKAGREEFEKRFYPLNKDGILSDDFKNGKFFGRKETLEEIPEIILSQELAILKSVEEWAEKNAKEISDAYSFNIKYNYSDFISLTDLITFLKEQSEIIKE